MKIDTEYIERLADIINKKGLTEISVDDGDQAVTIRKEIPEVLNVPHPVVSPIGVVDPATSTELANSEIKPTLKGKAITSPMVGTFYASSSPETEPFVEIGSEIKEGDVVCIIEAMKLMNEIKSEHAGKITQICVKNGDPIEYGQVLMYIE